LRKGRSPFGFLLKGLAAVARIGDRLFEDDGVEILGEVQGPIVTPEAFEDVSGEGEELIDAARELVRSHEIDS
jgi:hypothetical protein